MQGHGAIGIPHPLVLPREKEEERNILDGDLTVVEIEMELRGMSCGSPYSIAIRICSELLGHSDAQRNVNKCEGDQVSNFGLFVFVSQD